MENQSVLSKYKRQPKIYLKLPSGGKWYPKNPMEKSGSGELPIYSMTAKDELMIKTPDALMSGEATVEVIKSCCPLIDDPWSMPAIDLDAVLIAIRIATYGEKMEMTVPIRYKEDGKEQVGSETIEIDLRELLDKMQGKIWNDSLTVGDLTFTLHPLTYKESTGFFMSTFENQRLAQMMQNDKLNDSQKMEAFKEGFKKLSQMTLDMIVTHITQIETPEGTETNKNAIKDFFNQTDKDTFSAVQEHLDKVKKEWETPATIFKVPDEYVEKGAPETINVPMVFDNSNFFV
jgi:soluble cytochrome b562